MFLVATLNSNSQTKTKPFKTARAELPSLPARFCKIWNANFLKIFTFSQEFLLSWDKDLDFLLAGHWEYMFLLLLEFFPHVILITWGLESGLAKFFLQNLFLYGSWNALKKISQMITSSKQAIFPFSALPHMQFFKFEPISSFASLQNGKLCSNHTNFFSGTPIVLIICHWLPACSSISEKHHSSKEICSPWSAEFSLTA